MSRCTQIEVSNIMGIEQLKFTPGNITIVSGRNGAGKVGLIVADGLERFDEETYRTFEAAAASAGLQFVVGRVGSGTLSVRTMGTEGERAA